MRILYKNKVITQFFKKYYSSLKINEKIMDPIYRREFAFTYFDFEGMHRHISFKHVEGLINYLKSRTPSNVYMSTALYMNPSATAMDLKAWFGSEVTFDIDVDHIPTDCKFKHDSWKCEKCGYESRGIAPQRCPNCGYGGLKKWTWICNECLTEAKRQVIRLIEDFLMNDLGLTSDELIINFSGHRGYHVRIKSETYLNLDSNARGLLINYIMGIGAKDMFENEILRSRKRRGYSIFDLGWRGKIARGLYELLNEASKDTLLKIGLDETSVEDILKMRDLILNILSKENAIWTFVNKLGVKNIYKLVTEAIKRNSVIIDERVTKDVSRLIRMPESLHGSTGLKAALVKYKDLDKFDPSKDAVVFNKGYLEIEITNPRIYDLELGDHSLNLNEIEIGRTITLPTEIALYLVLGGHAIIVGG